MLLGGPYYMQTRHRVCSHASVRGLSWSNTRVPTRRCVSTWPGRRKSRPRTPHSQCKDKYCLTVRCYPRPARAELSWVDAKHTLGHKLWKNPGLTIRIEKPQLGGPPGHGCHVEPHTWDCAVRTRKTWRMVSDSGFTRRRTLHRVYHATINYQWFCVIVKLSKKRERKKDTQPDPHILTRCSACEYVRTGLSALGRGQRSAK